jgi:hypothetical protein
LLSPESKKSDASSARPVNSVKLSSVALRLLMVTEALKLWLVVNEDVFMADSIYC